MKDLIVRLYNYFSTTPFLAVVFDIVYYVLVTLILTLVLYFFFLLLFDKRESKSYQNNVCITENITSQTDYVEVAAIKEICAACIALDKKPLRKSGILQCDK
jgi:hypothetical protein